MDIPYPDKACQIDCTIQANLQEQGWLYYYYRFFYYRTNPIAREIKSYRPSYTTSKTSDTVSSTAPNQCFEVFRYISSKTALRSGSPRGAFLVDKKSNSLCNGRSLILPPPDLLMATDTTTKGWKTSYQGVSTGGPWSKEEQKDHISVLDHTKIGTDDFHKTQESPKDTSSNGQLSGINLTFENVGNSQEETLGLCQRYLELSTIQKDHDYCRISTKPPESGIRLAFKECPRQQRVETLYICVPKNLSENGYSQYRPLCVSNVTPISFLHGLETQSWDPKQQMRCNKQEEESSHMPYLPSV